MNDKCPYDTWELKTFNGRCPVENCERRVMCQYPKVFALGREMMKKIADTIKDEVKNENKIMD